LTLWLLTFLTWMESWLVLLRYDSLQPFPSFLRIFHWLSFVHSSGLIGQSA
jgi:hypothetical protein